MNGDREGLQQSGLLEAQAVGEPVEDTGRYGNVVGEGAVTVSGDAQTVAAAVRESTGGAGADLAIEVVGVSPAVQTAIASVRKGGRVGLIGNVSPMVELALQAVVTRELALYGCCASSGEYPESIDLLASGRVDVGPLISAVAPLSEGAGWFDRLYGGAPGLMKVVLQPGPGGPQ